MGTGPRGTGLARIYLLDALRGRRTADRYFKSIPGGRPVNQGATGHNPRPEVRDGGDIRGNELPHVEGIPGRSIHIGDCPICESPEIHYHIVIPPVGYTRQGIPPVPRKDA